MSSWTLKMLLLLSFLLSISFESLYFTYSYNICKWDLELICLTHANIFLTDYLHGAHEDIWFKIFLLNFGLFTWDFSVEFTLYIHAYIYIYMCVCVCIYIPLGCESIWKKTYFLLLLVLLWNFLCFFCFYCYFLFSNCLSTWLNLG